MNGGWIGVDLDGTLAQYDGWNGGEIGPPVPLMLQRVKDWLGNGEEVRIVTARVSGTTFERQYQASIIDLWCLEHIGQVLPITNQKDFNMIQLWDDRAVQVIPNTGKRVDGEE